MEHPKRILVIDGHPSDKSLCRSLGSAYVDGATMSGFEVRHLVLAHLEFDPILREGFKSGQVLEPDLAQAQQHIQWADHLVFVHPVWWSNMPALLRGFIDRVFLPGFAFKYHTQGILWDKLLKGKSARVIFTLDTPLWIYRLFLGAPSEKALVKGVLRFCGVGPVKSSGFGPIRRSPEEKRRHWLEQVRRLGQGGN